MELQTTQRCVYRILEIFVCAAGRVHPGSLAESSERGQTSCSNLTSNLGEGDICSFGEVWRLSKTTTTSGSTQAEQKTEVEQLSGSCDVQNTELRF